MRYPMKPINKPTLISPEAVTDRSSIKRMATAQTPIAVKGKTTDANGQVHLLSNDTVADKFTARWACSNGVSACQPENVVVSLIPTNKSLAFQPTALSFGRV